MHKIIPITKAIAGTIAGSVTQTSKMPCKSYSLPTVACITGAKMAQIEGSICSKCYAMKGNYAQYANNIEPAQHARLDSVLQACENAEYAQAWIDAMSTHIGSDEYFRWHDSGDLQSLAHLELIAAVCEETPNCNHWLPTREYGIVKEYIAKHGALPKNMVIRLSAMYIDKPVIVPQSLIGADGVEVSNVHKNTAPIGIECKSPTQGNKCLDCRVCFHRSGAVSYAFH
jgi:hypothetical protein